jgi:hypothetical protein
MRPIIKELVNWVRKLEKCRKRDDFQEMAAAVLSAMADEIERLSQANAELRELAEQRRMDNNELRSQVHTLLVYIGKDISTGGELATKAYEEGGSAQKAFWEGFERGAIKGAANIRQHWNEYKKHTNGNIT